MKFLFYILIALIFVACSESNTNSAQTAPETEATNDKTILSSIVIAIKTKEDLKKYDVYGDYWSRPNVKEVEDNDEYIKISKSTEKEVWAHLHYEVYAAIASGNEVELSPVMDCSATLVLVEENTFSIKLASEDESCLIKNNSKLYFVQQGDEKGLSLDGKTFAFYKK